jgi:hypothetical protein
MSPMQGTSWLSLRDVVGALIGAIRPPASTSLEGPSQEERQKR